MGLVILTKQFETMEFRRRDPIRDKRVINNKIIEEIIKRSNYFGVHVVE
jgi:hypothetical protein